MTRAEMELRIQNAIQASTMSGQVKANRVAIATIALNALMPVEQAVIPDLPGADPLPSVTRATLCGISSSLAPVKPLYRFTVE